MPHGPDRIPGDRNDPGASRLRTAPAAIAPVHVFAGNPVDQSEPREYRVRYSSEWQGNGGRGIAGTRPGGFAEAL